MIINNLDSGKDATIDPAYLARIRTSGSSSGEIEELQREVAAL